MTFDTFAFFVSCDVTRDTNPPVLVLHYAIQYRRCFNASMTPDQTLKLLHMIERKRNVMRGSQSHVA
jgi:hypothetical protein